jgi:hypothetical protein
VVTQAEIDSNGGGDGFIENTATADSNETGPDTDDASVPVGLSPSLLTTKVDDGDTFDSVGDVIDYTITVSNTGNTTLTVTVLDPNAFGLDCDGAAGVPLVTTGLTIEVGHSITCTASHTVTQPDLDAGSYFNEACADDGQGGADEACGDVTTPGDKNPELSITKVDDVDGFDTFDAVGQVITYTIIATNTGNVTLTDVDVTDDQVSDLECTPTVPVASLAPDGMIICSASHTITQEDLDAGSYFNEACVDDGEGGAVEDCADVTTPGDQNPALDITKVAAEADYNEVGDVVHYTITATNAGNVTLHNVVVTDPNVTDLACTPTLPVADLAPGDSIDCTASHTVVQADLDLGTVFNEACVDDGQGGAIEDCAHVTTPGIQSGGETDVPTQAPTDSQLQDGGSSPAGIAWILVIGLGIVLGAMVLFTPARGRRRR